MVIGDRLRALREGKKFTQGDIEKRTGLLRAYISRVENGHTSDIESYWPRRMPSLPAQLSMPTSGSDAMSAAKSIFINPQMC